MMIPDSGLLFWATLYMYVKSLVAGTETCNKSSNCRVRVQVRGQVRCCRVQVRVPSPTHKV